MMGNNVALIGDGYWGTKLKRYIDANDNLTIKYICNSRSDLNEVWSDSEVSGVVIATPNPTHYELTRQSLLNGRHVLCEKPLAKTTKECLELSLIAKENKLTLLTDYTFTFSKGLIKLYNLLYNDRFIRQPLCFDMQLKRLGKFYDDNVYWRLASHMLAALDTFVRLDEMSFTKLDMIKQGGIVETGVIYFQSQAINGQITVSFNSPSRVSSITIYGATGTILYNTISAPTLKIDTYERKEGQNIGSQTFNYYFDEHNNLQEAIHYFSLCMNRQVQDNIETSIEVTRVLEGLEC